MTGNAAIVSAIDAIGDEDPEAGLLVLEPRERFDQCIVGIGERFSGSYGIESFVVYDRACVLRVKAEDVLSDPDFEEDEDNDPHLIALEDFEFNTLGGYVGPHTPAFVSLGDE